MATRTEMEARLAALEEQVAALLAPAVKTAAKPKHAKPTEADSTPTAGA